MMRSYTVLRLIKVAFLAATLICSCVALPLRPKHPDLLLDSKLPAPILKQLQETTRQSGSRTHQFPANSVDSLERDMREAESTTTIAQLAATESGTVAQTTPGSSVSEETTQEQEPTGADSPSQMQLRDLLREYYFSNKYTGYEKPGNFFVYFDLFKTGPLSDQGDAIRSSQSINHHRSVCNRVASGLNTDRHATDLCHWRFSCNFNENRFPSSIVNATTCTAGDGAECVQRTQPIMTFTRTYDSDGQASWTRTGEINIVYGYTCRRR